MPSSSRQNAIRKAREYLSIQPVLLDTETTGLDPWSEIIEICIIRHTGEVLINQLIRPVKPIPLDAIRVHGISNEMVQNAPTWPEVWPAVEQVLSGKYIGIYNADFDLRLMKQSHQRYGLDWQFPTGKIFDVMKLYSEFSGYQRWQSLEAAGRQCGLPLPNAHRAEADTLLLRALFLHIAGQGSW